MKKYKKEKLVWTRVEILSNFKEIYNKWKKSITLENCKFTGLNKPKVSVETIVIDRKWI